MQTLGESSVDALGKDTRYAMPGTRSAHGQVEPSWIWKRRMPDATTANRLAW